MSQPLEQEHPKDHKICANCEQIYHRAHISGKKNEREHQLLGLEIFWRGVGLPCEGVRDAQPKNNIRSRKSWHVNMRCI